MAPWGHPAEPQGFGETWGLSDIWSSRQPWTSRTAPPEGRPQLFYKCIIIHFLPLLPTRNWWGTIIPGGRRGRAEIDSSQVSLDLGKADQ